MLIFLVAANEPSLLIDYIKEPKNSCIVKVPAFVLLAIVMIIEFSDVLEILVAPFIILYRLVRWVYRYVISKSKDRRKKTGVLF